jgi:hypothetical protein
MEVTLRSDCWRVVGSATEPPRALRAFALARNSLSRRVIMSHPLDGCWEKVKRADHNIDRLNQLTTRFVHLHGHDFREEFNADRTEYTYRIFGPPSPPLEFAVRAGEIINHLRSSLDHLVWQLVLQQHQTPDFRVQYPICLNRKNYRSALSNGILKGVSGSARTIIEQTQPYHAPVPHDDPLAILHDLNNIDKHKLLLVVTCHAYIHDTINLSGDPIQSREVEFVPKDWSNRKIRAVESGAEFVRVRFSSPKKVGMYAEVSQHIALEKFGVRQDEPLIPSLKELRDAVMKALELFKGEFV